MNFTHFALFFAYEFDAFRTVFCMWISRISHCFLHMNLTHFALFFACFSTSASEHSDQSDSEIISSHAESDAEVTRGHSRQFGGRGHVTYSRDYLLSFAAKNTHMPSALPDLDFILHQRANVEKTDEISEPIRQPRGPLQGKRGFLLKRK